LSGRSIVRRGWQRFRWRGRRCEREPAVDDGIALFALAVLVDHAVNVSHPLVGAAQVPGRCEIGGIDDSHLVLQMILVERPDPLNEVRLRTQNGDRLFALDVPKRQDGDTLRLRRSKRRFDRDGVDDESLPFPVAD
jgi:hypothetical protein